MKRLVALALLASSSGALAAGLAVDTPIGAHAVVQRDRALTVAGDAPPASAVTVSFDAVTVNATADAHGRWQVTLPSHAAGGPCVLAVSDGARALRFDDVLVGDVWLCSGQSNMEFTLRHATNAEAEVAGSANPQIRLLNVPEDAAPAPLAAFRTAVPWQAASPASTANFSAACFIMGRELQARAKVPVGLISSAYGGSIIEAWISREALGTVPRYAASLTLLDRYAGDPAAAGRAWAADLERWLGVNVQVPAGAVWRPVPMPMTWWEGWGGSDLATFDGIGYYRAHVTLTPDQVRAARMGASLDLPAIDDMDLTRVNGRTVGGDDGWDKLRHYRIAARALKAGDNVIDVVAIDIGGGGGMHGDVAPSVALADGSVIPLTDWRFTPGLPLAQTGLPPSQPWQAAAGLTTLYNAMIAPLHGYPVKGFAWYQGEANVSDAKGYAALLPLLLRDWRGRFGTEPFVEVQLARFGPLSFAPHDDAWAALRDVQRRVADADPEMGMASAVDVGQVGDIHPTDKQTVGHRLALAEAHLALGAAGEDRGPSPLSVTRAAGGIAVRFAHGPLAVAGGGEVLGFEECDGAGHCHFVVGVPAGDAVILPGDDAARTVRYLWQASPLVNLYNSAGLPATGFTMPMAGMVPEGAQ